VPGKNAESWKILEDLYKSGRIKSVGVSNFVETNIDKLVVGAKVCTRR